MWGDLIKAGGTFLQVQVSPPLLLEQWSEREAEVLFPVQGAEHSSLVPLFSGIQLKVSIYPPLSCNLYLAMRN